MSTSDRDTGSAAVDTDSSSSNLAQQRFQLTSICTSVRAGDLLARPELTSLAAEDLAWAIAFDDCSRREPRRWQLGRRRRWAAEVENLFDERARLQELAAELGLPG
jgi:hypothetical protein